MFIKNILFVTLCGIFIVVVAKVFPAVKYSPLLMQPKIEYVDRVLPAPTFKGTYMMDFIEKADKEKTCLQVASYVASALQDKGYTVVRPGEAPTLRVTIGVIMIDVNNPNASVKIASGGSGATFFAKSYDEGEEGNSSVKNDIDNLVVSQFH